MSAEISLGALLRATEAVEGHRPWPRHRLTEGQWRDLIATMDSADWTLLGLWAEPAEIHMALSDETSGEIAVVSLACAEGTFPSVSGVRPSAIRLERAIRDLFGLEPEGLEDRRGWFDHGQWGQGAPLAAQPGTGRAPGYAFLEAEGEGLHQIPVGPVHAGIIEPGHFRFHANGETVVRLEERLGYVHKGIEKLMEGRTPQEAARLASRISGDSAVAHSLAFARAVEAALGVVLPPRAHALRAVMAEMERLANHLGDIGAICNDAAFALLLADCATLREWVLRAAKACFGHRLMMDRVVPGGVAADLDEAGAKRLAELVAKIRPRFEDVVVLYDDKASLQDRTLGTGIVPASLAHRFGAGGYVGRASSRGKDARRQPGYPPYDRLEFDVPVRAQGDVNARIWIRIEEVRGSLKLIERLVAGLPGGSFRTDLPEAAGEGMAIVEGFRGDILTWVRLGPDGRIRRCHPRDPSWFQWPLLEAAIEGNIVADFPLCNKSFNCSYSGHDL